MSDTVPGRPGSFPLCWGRHARRRSTPAVRSRSLCCRVPSSKEEPRESIPRSVPAIPATVPDRPSSFSLCLRRARPPFAGRSAFGLGRCVAVFHSQGPRSREEPPANQFRGQCPLPYPIVPVLSGYVGPGTPAVRSWSLCCCVPFSREEPPANQFRGQCPLPYPIVPVLSGMFRSYEFSREEPPANQFRGQCPLPYPVVPVLSRCVGAGTPTVRSWSLCWHVPFSREEPRESFPRSVPAIPATVPDRPGSFPLCWGGHARRSVLVVVLPCSVLKGGAPPRINSEVSVRYRTGSSRFFPAVRCDVEVRLCALLRLFGVRFAPRRPLSCTTSFGRDECR